MNPQQFAAEIDRATVELREFAEARMDWSSRCTIRRLTGQKTTDGDGWEVPEWVAAYTDLPLRIGGSDRSRTVSVGDAEVEVASRIASFPACTDDLHDGDLIDVTDGENAGAVLRIVEASWRDQATARRVPVVETQRPEEWP